MEQTNSMSQGKIAVITGMSYLDVDRIIASVVLAKSLGNKHNTTVDISLGYALSPKIVEKIVSTERIKIVQNVTLAQRMLTLDNISQQVSDIKWNQSNGKIDLELLNANGERIDPSKSSLKYKSSSYQQVFTVGIRSANYLLRLLSNSSESDLNEVDITSINVVNKKDFGFPANRFVNDSVHSFSASIFNYCQANSISLSKTELTELLAGIYWKTNSFRNYYTTPDTLAAAQKLLISGANLQAANQRIFGQLSHETQKLWQQLLENQKTEQGITVTSAKDIHDYEKLLNNTLLPIFVPQFFANTHASIVGLPISDNKSLILATTLRPELNLHKLLRQFSPKGDDLQVKVILEENLTDALNKVATALAKQNGADSIPKPTQPNKQSSEVKETSSETEEQELTEKASKIVKAQDKDKPETPSTEPATKAKQPEEPKQTETQKETPEKKEEATPTQKEDIDPLAPAQIDYTTLVDDEDEDKGATNGSSSPFGFGGGSDPLPAASSK